MKKRILSIILCLMMLLSFVPVTALAEGANVSMTVTPSARTLTTLQVGDKVTVAVSCRGMTVSTFTFNVKFDKDTFTCDAIKSTLEGEDVYLKQDSNISPFVQASTQSTVTEANSTGSIGFGWSNTKNAQYLATDLVVITFTAKATGNANFVLSENSGGTDGFKNTASTTSATILKTPMEFASFTLTAPVKGQTLGSASTTASAYAVTSTAWYEGDAASGTAVTGEAKANQIYTAKVTLTADTQNGESFIIEGFKADGWTVASNDGSVVVLTKTFAKTDPKGETTVTWNDKGDNNKVTFEGKTYDGQPYTPRAKGGEIGETATDDVNKMVAVTRSTATRSFRYYTDNNGSVGSELSAAPTDAGTYWIKVEVAGNAYFNGAVSEARKFTIAKKQVTASVTAENKTYDGNTAVTVSAKVATGIDGETLEISGLTGEFSDANVGNGKTVTVNSTSKVISAANDASSTNPDNYDVTIPDTTTANITAATMTGVNASDYSGPYDGAAHGITVNNVPAGATVTYCAIKDGTYQSELKYTNVTTENNGVYTVFYKVEKANYTTVSGSSTVTINPKSVTITGLGAEDKTYDGTTAATVTGTAAVNGKVGSDDVIVTAGSAAFADANAGTGKTVTFSGYSLSGADAGNYKLSAQPASVTANITAKELTVSGVTPSATVTKVYDGNTDVKQTFMLTLTGVVSGETVTANYTGAAYDSKTAGMGKTVTLSGITLSGTTAGNYTVANTTTTTGAIDPKSVTITGLGAEDKTYDGTKTATVTGTAAVNGKVGSDDVIVTAGSAAFADANADTGKTVTFSGYSLSGADAGNYTLSAQPASVTANIIAKELTVSGVTPSATVTKVYDGNTDVKQTFMLTLTGVVSGETVTANYTDAVYDSKTVGTNKTVTLSGITLSGTTAGNYTVANTTTTIGAITAKSVTITGLSAENKTYDGTKTATVTGTAEVSGKVGSDDVVADVSNGSAAFADAYAGADKDVTFSGYSLSGTDKGNYTLSGQPASVKANLTAATQPLSCTNSSITKGTSKNLSTCITNKVDGAAPSFSLAESKEGVTLSGSILSVAADVAEDTQIVVNVNSDAIDLNRDMMPEYVAATQASMTLTVVKKQTATVKIEGYTGYAKNVIYRPNGTFTLTASVDQTGGDWSWSSSNPDVLSLTNANSATVTVTILKANATPVTLTATYESDTHKGEVTASITVDKADLSYSTTPSAKTELVYTGSELTLVEDGAVEGGTIWYKLDSGEYGTTVPTATNAGTYTVYYKAVADNSTNYNDIEERSFTVTIAKADPTYTAPTAKTLTYTGSAQALVAAGEAVGGDMVYSTTDNGTYTANIPTGTDAGSYTVWYKVVGDGNHNDSTAVKITVTIGKADSAVTKEPTANTLTYTGSAQALVAAGEAVGGDMVYSTTDNGTYTANIPTGTDAGSYTVWYKVMGDGNHNDVAAKSVSVTIGKADSSVTKEPTANTLTYTGSAQALVTAGTAEGGTMQYSLTENGTYSATIPTGTNAGDYTVWYKVVGDKNHENTTPASVAVTIGKADATCTAPTAKALTYTGSAQALVSAGTASGGEMQYCLTEDGTYSTTIPTDTDAGSYTVWYKVVGDSNHNDVTAKSVAVTIGKADPTYTAPTAKTLTYTNAAQDLVTAGKATGGEMQYCLTEDGTYSTTIPTGTDAGSYTVWYKVVGDSNHKDVAAKTVTVTITKAAAPGVTGVSGGDCTTYKQDNGKITGVTTAMEYKLSTASVWTKCTGTEITGLVPGDYEIRVAETANVLAGTAAEVTIKKHDCKFTTYTYHNDATCAKNGTETAHCTGEGCTATNTREKANSTTAHAYVNGKCTGCGAVNPVGTTLSKETVTSVEKVTALVETGAITVEESKREALVHAIQDGTLTTKNEVETATPDANKKSEFIAEAESIVNSDSSMKNAEVVDYLDISVALVNSNDDDTKLGNITETDQPVTFQIKLADTLLADLEGKSVFVLRAHGSEITKLPATLSADGILTFSSDKFSTYAIVAYEPVSGGSHHGGSYNPGHTVTSDLGNVTRVTVDGKVVDSKYYTVSGGNVVLSGEFMKTLTNGKHTVKLYNGSIAATGVITVTGNIVQAPRTGDAGAVLYGVMAISSVLGMGWVARKKRCEK